MLLILVISSVFSTVTIPSNPSLFEISTRPWLYWLSQKYGTEMQLKDVPDNELDDLQNQGYNIIWLMGVWELGNYSLNIAKTDEDLLESYAEVLPEFALFCLSSFSILPVTQKMILLVLLMLLSIIQSIP